VSRGALTPYPQGLGSPGGQELLPPAPLGGLQGVGRTPVCGEQTSLATSPWMPTSAKPRVRGTSGWSRWGGGPSSANPQVQGTSSPPGEAQRSPPANPRIRGTS